MSTDRALQNGATLLEMLYAILVIFGAIGYVVNLMLIWDTANLPMTGKFLLRVIGVFVVPLGAVMGFF